MIILEFIFQYETYCPELTPFSYSSTCYQSCTETVTHPIPIQLTITPFATYMCQPLCTYENPFLLNTDFSQLNCISNCPQGSNKNQFFIFTGSYGTYQTFLCVHNCTSPFNDIRTFEFTIGLQCVSTCSSMIGGYTLESINSVQYKLCHFDCEKVDILTASLRQCVQECGYDKPFLNQYFSNHFECVSQCVFVYNLKCVSRCPNLYGFRFEQVNLVLAKTCIDCQIQTSEIMFAGMMQCVDDCTSNYPFYTKFGENKLKCVLSCESVNLEHICTNCPQNYQHITLRGQKTKQCISICNGPQIDKECLAECPVTKPFQDEDNQCVSSCVFVLQDNKCSDTCDFKEFGFQKVIIHGFAANKCINCQYVDQHSKFHLVSECIDSCDQNQPLLIPYFNKYQCTTQCEYVNSGQICINSCIFGFDFQQIGSLSQKVCQENCNILDFVYYNKPQCVSICPAVRPFAKYNGSINICVFDCLYVYQQIALLYCSDSCPVQGQISSFGQFKFIQVGSYKVKKCFQECNTIFFNEQPEKDYQCVERCSFHYTYLIIDNIKQTNKYKCVQRCNFWVQDNNLPNICVDNCTGLSPGYILDQINRCNDICPETARYYLNEQYFGINQCVEKCPSDQQLLFGFISFQHGGNLKTSYLCTSNCNFFEVSPNGPVCQKSCESPKGFIKTSIQNTLGYQCLLCPYQFIDFISYRDVGQCCDSNCPAQRPFVTAIDSYYLRCSAQCQFVVKLDNLFKCQEQCNLSDQGYVDFELNGIYARKCLDKCVVHYYTAIKYQNAEYCIENCSLLQQDVLIEFENKLYCSNIQNCQYIQIQNSNYICKQDCFNSFQFITIVNLKMKECLVCLSGYFIQNDEDTNLQCIQENCTMLEDAPFYLLQNNGFICTSDSLFVQNTSSMLLVSNSCSKGWGYKIFQISIKIETNLCSECLYIDLYYQINEVGKCVEQCTYPRFQIEQFTNYSICKSNCQIIDNYTNICLDRCSNDTYGLRQYQQQLYCIQCEKFFENGYCVEVCSSSNLLHLPIQSIFYCVNSCNFIVNEIECNETCYLQYEIGYIAGTLQRFCKSCQFIDIPTILDAYKCANICNFVSSKFCVDSCDLSQVKHDPTFHLECVSDCALTADYFYSNVMRDVKICIDNCIGMTYQNSKGKNECISIQNCLQFIKKVYFDNQCVSFCDYFIIDEIYLVCEMQCPTVFIVKTVQQIENQKVCLEKCPFTQRIVQNPQNTEKQCVNSCNLFISDNYVSQYGLCLESCETNLSSSQMECIESCELIQNGVCVDNCDESWLKMPFQLPNSIFIYQCVQECFQPYIFKNHSSCVFECDNKQYIEVFQKFECQTCSFYEITALGVRCHQTCPDYQIFDSQECISQENIGFGKCVFELSQQICVENCSFLVEILQNKSRCVEICSVNYFQIDQKCVLDCPVFKKNNFCVESCDFVSQKICVENCNLQFLGRCVDECFQFVEGSCIQKECEIQGDGLCVEEISFYQQNGVPNNDNGWIVAVAVNVLLIIFISVVLSLKTKKISEKQEQIQINNKIDMSYKNTQILEEKQEAHTKVQEVDEIQKKNEEIRDGLIL